MTNLLSLDPSKCLGMAVGFDLKGWIVSAEMIKQATNFSVAGIP